MSKILVGVVVKNSNNKFLITKKEEQGMLDFGLVSGEVEQENLLQGVKDMLLAETGVDFSSEIEVDALMTGIDNDGEFVILYCEKDFENMQSKTGREILWVPFSKIKKLYKDDRLNDDQFEVLLRAERRSQQNIVANKNAMKVNHAEIKRQKELNGRGNNFHDDMENETKQARLHKRINSGRRVSPCGKECHKFGFVIAQSFNHSSFQKFDELMNDEEFLIQAAGMTPNPVECTNYMYFWVNNFLKKKTEFKLAFLKAIYLNENVYKLEDINTIVDALGLRHENKILLADDAFMEEFKKRIDGVSYQDMIEYHCSGEDKEELHDYKVQANNYKVLCDNITKGLMEILKTFKGYKEEEKQEEIVEVQHRENSFIEKLLTEGRYEARGETLTAAERKAKEENDNFWANFEPGEIRRSWN